PRREQGDGGRHAGGVQRGHVPSVVPRDRNRNRDRNRSRLDFDSDFDFDFDWIMTQFPAPRWYQGLDRYCWVVLVIAALGWMFDTMDQNLFNLVRKQSLEDLLRP